MTHLFESLLAALGAQPLTGAVLGMAVLQFGSLSALALIAADDDEGFLRGRWIWFAAAGVILPPLVLLAAVAWGLSLPMMVVWAAVAAIAGLAIWTLIPKSSDPRLTIAGIVSLACLLPVLVAAAF